MTAFAIVQLVSSTVANFFFLFPKGWKVKVLLISLLIFVGVPVYRAIYRRAVAPSTFHYEFVGASGSYRYAQILDDILDERDLIELGVTAYEKLRPGSSDGLKTAFLPRIASLKIAAGHVFPSPFATTAFGLQTPEYFQMLKFDAPTLPSTATAIRPAIFLHGLAGNFTLECWLGAEILTREGFTTYCPSTRLMGDWWSTESQQILENTITRVQRDFPTQPILFVGLSNGAAGLMQNSRTRKNATGYILISGGRADFDIPLVPTLLVTGTKDELYPVSAAQSLKASSPNNITLVELPSDHFVLARSHDEVAAAIHQWLAAPAPKSNSENEPRTF